VRFPFAELFLERYQVDAIWWSFPLSSVLSAILALAYYRYGGWRSAHMRTAPSQAPPRTPPQAP